MALHPRKSLQQDWLLDPMRIFCHLIVMGAGTALALNGIDYAVAQSDSIPQAEQFQSSHRPASSDETDQPSTFISAAPGITIDPLDVNLAQQIAQNGLPSVEPAVPSPAPGAPAPAAPAPTPGVVSPPLPSARPGVTPPPPSPPAPLAPPAPPTSPLDNLNPNPNLLENPTDPAQVRTGTTQPLTLGQALELARRNNRPLQTAILELQRDRSALREQRAARFPVLSTQADFTRQQSASGGFNNNNQIDPQTGQPIDQGGSDAVDALTGTVQLSYDIFTSGRRSGNIRAAEEQVRFSELEVERLTEQLRLDVSNNYYDVQQADEQVRIARAAIANSQASLRDAQALERAGLGTRFDVLQQQVEVANDQQALTDAFAQQRISRRQLAQQLSLPLAVDVSALDPVELAARYDRTLEESIVLAFQNRAELSQQLAQRNISRQRRRVALADLRPQVSLVANYNVQNFNIANDDQGFSGFQDGYSIGPQVNLLLFDGGASRARAAQEEANIRIAETNFSDTRNQVRFLVEQAYFNLQSTFANTRTATTALGQARESLRLARLRFQAGVGTQTDVIAAQSALTEAEGNVVQAVIGYNRSLASLQREISGVTLTAP